MSRKKDLSNWNDPLLERTISLVGENLDSWDNTPKERESLRQLYADRSQEDLQAICEKLKESDP